LEEKREEPPRRQEEKKWESGKVGRGEGKKEVERRR
jgi:hypothetical protein